MDRLPVLGRALYGVHVEMPRNGRAKGGWGFDQLSDRENEGRVADRKRSDALMDGWINPRRDEQRTGVERAFGSSCGDSVCKRKI